MQRFGPWCALVLVGCGAASASAPAPEPVHASAPAPAPVSVSAPAPAPVIVEEGDPIASATLSEAGPHALHLVLEAGRCYRVVASADARVALQLVDEHGHALASGAGRVVRVGAVCPRWSGSFELRAELEGGGGRVALYDEDASPAPEPADAQTSSTTR